MERMCRSVISGCDFQSTVMATLTSTQSKAAMLMNMFYRSIRVHKKQRLHFNEFMMDAHKRMCQILTIIIIILYSTPIVKINSLFIVQYFLYMYYNNSTCIIIKENEIFYNNFE